MQFLVQFKTFFILRFLSLVVFLGFLQMRWNGKSKITL